MQGRYNSNDKGTNNSKEKFADLGPDGQTKWRWWDTNTDENHLDS